MTEPVIVKQNAGIVDALTAAARYAGVLITFSIAMLGLLKTHDIAGIINYIQTHGGEALAALSGLIALGTAAYGIFKSHKRGSEVAQVAADPKVPDSSAHLK